MLRALVVTLMLLATPASAQVIEDWPDLWTGDLEALEEKPRRDPVLEYPMPGIRVEDGDYLPERAPHPLCPYPDGAYDPVRCKRPDGRDAE
jgi:hypothetical protein